MWKKKFIAGGISAMLLLSGQTVFAESSSPWMEEFEQAQQARDTTLDQIEDLLKQMNGSDDTSSVTAERIQLLLEFTLQDAQVQGARSINNLIHGAQEQADIYAVMALFQQLAQEQRSAAREVRNIEMQNQVNTLKNAADQIRQAAADRFSAAIISGSFQIAGGVTSIGVGASGTIGVGSHVRVPSDEWDVARGFQGIGMFPSNFADKGSEAAHSVMDANKKLAEQEKILMDQMMHQMMDVIRDVRDRLHAIQQTEIETNRSIVRN